MFSHAPKMGGMRWGAPGADGGLVEPGCGVGLADRDRFGGLQQAQYFSTGTYMEIGDWRHYALAVPMYTHFTSPIRRYPDVIVHRLLARLLAQDPRAATQAFCPNPIGTLEHDKAEGVCFNGSKPW